MEIRFAKQTDEEELRSILLGYGMDIAGNVEEHVIIRKDGEILAGGKLTDLEQDLFHLEVLGVRDDQRGTGVGGELLSKLISNPWYCCGHAGHDMNSTCRVTTVARGAAVDFYISHGFKPCTFSSLDRPYNEQCKDCPDREKCSPVPMEYIGGEDSAECDYSFYQST